MTQARHLHIGRNLCAILPEEDARLTEFTSGSHAHDGFYVPNTSLGVTKNAAPTMASMLTRHLRMGLSHSFIQTRSGDRVHLLLTPTEVKRSFLCLFRALPTLN